jgi:hypothetical protein
MPIIVNGFPSIRRLIANKNGVLPEFSDVFLNLDNHGAVATGTIQHIARFVGVPFLGQQTQGKLKLVEQIRQTVSDLYWRPRT